MASDIIQTPTPTPDLSHRLRRLGFFGDHFRRQIRLIADRYHLDVTVDPVLLTRAFLDWGEEFTRQRRAASVDRRDYVVFTAGILLLKLLETDPVTVVRKDADEDGGGDGDVVAIWPKGFVYTQYCLRVLQAVLEQEFGEHVDTTPAAASLAVWTSFRENVRDDPASAVGFFDLFVGRQPNWWFPTVAAQRPAMSHDLSSPTALR